MTKSEEYANKVLDNEIISCDFIKQLAKNLLKDVKRKDLIWDLEAIEKLNYWFDEIACVPELRKPMGLAEPHAFWLEQIHGFKYKDTGLRRFRSAYVQVARKNIKTFISANNALIETVAGRDKSSFVMVGANSRDQAIICTDMVGKIVNCSPELRELRDEGALELFTYRKKTTEVVYQSDERDCRIEAMPRDPGDGGNASIGIVDEFHEAKDVFLLETIESGQGQRLEPFTEVITSPGHNKNGPCYQVLRKKSIDVLYGKVKDDRHLGAIFELDDESEWDNIDMLAKSNPMMPYLPSLRPYLIERIKKAKIEGGSAMASVKIKNSGIWIDSPNIWIPSETIKQNNHGTSLDDLLGKKCYCGLDLSQGKDLNAFVMLFPNVNGKFVVRSLFWVPQEKVLNPKTDAVDYRKFVDTGHLKVFDGNVVEYNIIAQDIANELDKYETVIFGADAKYLYGGPVPYWNDHGYKGITDKIMPVGQGFNLTGATEQVEMWTAKNEMDFMGNPIMEMCFSNTTLHIKDSGNVQDGGISGHRFPAKGKSNGRIDGVSALVTAIHEYQRLSNGGPEAPKKVAWI